MDDVEFQKRVADIQLRRGNFPFLSKARKGKPVSRDDILDARRSNAIVHGTVFVSSLAALVLLMKWKVATAFLGTAMLGIAMFMALYSAIAFWQKSAAIREFLRLDACRRDR